MSRGRRAEQMTEVAYLWSRRPAEPQNGRRLRRLGCACVRGIWPLLRQPRSRAALTMPRRRSRSPSGKPLTDLSVSVRGLCLRRPRHDVCKSFRAPDQGRIGDHSRNGRTDMSRSATVLIVAVLALVGVLALFAFLGWWVPIFRSLGWSEGGAVLVAIGDHAAEARDQTRNLPAADW